MKTRIVLAFLFMQSAQAQNLLLNPDFELYTSCPVSLGQVDSAVSWQMVVESADYYNCGLSTSSYPTVPTAFSGTGVHGFCFLRQQHRCG